MSEVIFNFLDLTSRLLIDPSNKKHSYAMKGLAWTLTIFAAYATFGSIHVASALWRAFRHVKDENNTHELISQVFKRVIYGATPSIQTEEIPDESSESDSIEQGQFSSADLLIFRTALKSISDQAQRMVLNSFTFEDNLYYVWYRHVENQSINIQDQENFHNHPIQPDGKKDRHRNKLGMVIDDKGSIISVYVNGAPQPDNSLTIPDEFVGRLQTGFKRTLELSSQYGIRENASYNESRILGAIVRRGLKEVPEFHLRQISHHIQSEIQKGYKDPKIKLSFLKDDMTFDQGIDEGGLTRDGLDDLFDALVHLPGLHFIKSVTSSLMLPQAKECKPTNIFPMLSKLESETFTNIGKLLIYSYHSKKVAGHWDHTCCIGRHFDDALFRAILSLSAEEINTPFEKLTLETKLKVAKALLDAHKKAGNDVTEQLKHWQWLSGYESLTDDQLIEIANELCYIVCCLPNKFTLNNQGRKVDDNYIKQNKQQFKEYLTELLFETKSEAHGQLGAQMAPIHAIAQGMKLLCHPGATVLNDDNYWNAHIKAKEAAYVDFSTKIQGHLDRTAFANQLKFDYNRIPSYAKAEIEKKTGWLIEWVQNEATDEEYKKFMKFLNGCSSLPKDKIITVTAQEETPYKPFVAVHTCSYQIDLAPKPCSYIFSHNIKYMDDTKENFIKGLKKVSLDNPSTYSML